MYIEAYFWFLQDLSAQIHLVDVLTWLSMGLYHDLLLQKGSHHSPLHSTDQPYQTIPLKRIYNYNIHLHNYIITAFINSIPYAAFIDSFNLGKWPLHFQFRGLNGRDIPLVILKIWWQNSITYSVQPCMYMSIADTS